MDAELGRFEETRVQDVPWRKMGTGAVAKLIQLFGMLDAERMPEVGKEAAYAGSTTDRGGAKG